ncbi:MAG: acyl-CoA/acyl-ACP dehydrogenase [Thermaerobacter sp.]|nr:acyl-CoA/acyl-ACP dehydrogenase [Thermaerobacter sp.]
MSDRLDAGSNLAPHVVRLDDGLQTVVDRFWRDAGEVDEADVLPASHLEALGRLGLYGALAPRSQGGLGLTPHDLTSVVERLASGSLGSTFVWIQHFRLLRSLLDPATPATLRAWLPDVVTGTLKGGIALVGLMPGPPRLMATRIAGGWRLDGAAPWVSGWGLINLLLVTARGPHDTTVSLILDAAPHPGLTVDRARLSAMNASATVHLRFDGVTVDGGRLVSAVPVEGRPEEADLRSNGSLALGVVRRCCLLLGPTPLDQALRHCREQLDTAGVDNMPAARAAASALAVQAAHALAVARGSRAALVGDPAERLTREAAILLVFGSRPGIKRTLQQHFAPDGSAASADTPSFRA